MNIIKSILSKSQNQKSVGFKINSLLIDIHKSKFYICVHFYNYNLVRICVTKDFFGS